LPGELAVALNGVCESFGDAIALSNGECSLSYRLLAELAGRAAGELRRAGLAPNEPVHVRVSNHPRDLAAFLGVWNAGGVAVPVHRNAPEGVLSKLGDKTRARFLVDMQGADSTPRVSAIATVAPPHRPLLDDAAFIIFTSGSTGAPKGVVVSHRAFRGKIEQIDSLLEFQSNDRILLVLNITFSFGLWVSLLTLLRGGRLFMQEKFDPETFLDTLVDQQITRVGMVPTMMRILFSNPQYCLNSYTAASQGSPHQILIGGESLGSSLAAAIRQRFSGTRLIDIYGLTETATCDFFSFPEDAVRYPGCVGRPSPKVEFRIVAGDGAEAESGSTGELQISSPYLMRGYLDDPELSAAAFSGGWFKTGDLARTVDASVVEIMGRSKELISRGGNKVTPGEIEQLICTHPDVAAAMAVGVADALLGERIHLLVVFGAGKSLGRAELEGFVKNKLEKFKWPDAYYTARELPLGRTGKSDRGQFKSMIEAGVISPIPH
jgi:long-chain acyl-CoA synthetase